MSDCEFCGIVQGEYEGEEIYQDDKVMAVLHLKPAAPGHVLLFTKKHYAIIEEIPDDIMGHLLLIANKVSTGVFESIGCHGTNIIIENGTAAGQQIAHASVHIIPRVEDDKLNMEWQPKKLSDDDMDIVHAQLLTKTEEIDAHEEHEPDPKEHKKESVPQSENYKYKQLRRIP